MKILIMRGFSGSGKSTLAAQLAAETQGTVICSADDFMYVGGKYEWKKEKLPWAHGQCKTKARKACEDKAPLVIIDNTNLSSRDRRPYVALAEEFGYSVEVRQVGDFSEEFARVCAERNKHGVPLEFLLKLAQRFGGKEKV